MTDKEKRYWAYFLNVNGKIEYYEQCKKCVRYIYYKRITLCDIADCIFTTDP